MGSCESSSGLLLRCGGLITKVPVMSVLAEALMFLSTIGHKSQSNIVVKPETLNIANRDTETPSVVISWWKLKPLFFNLLFTTVPCPIPIHCRRFCCWPPSLQQCTLHVTRKPGQHIPCLILCSRECWFFWLARSRPCPLL